MADNRDTLTGLTEAEAKEFHGFFVMGTVGFGLLSLVAHILIWNWRPWF
jgi:light-harvesting complex 1 beta chain